MKLFRIFILSLICVFAAQSANSQVAVVPSDKKTVIGGKSFYLHTVKQGETLYSISKAYDVSQRDIILNNPDAIESIKTGEELKIPVKAEDEVKIPVKAEETPAGNRLQSPLFIYHITEKGQTVFWLMQQYNVSREELYRYNPALEHSPLQPGQVVTIPKKSSSAAQPSAPKPAGYVIHTVKRKETLFSIAKSYQADLNEIYGMNPELDPNDPKLSIGQSVKIPLPDTVSAELPTEISKTDDVVISQDVPSGGDGELPPYQFPVDPVVADYTSDCPETSQKEFRIAMFLPWFLADNSPASPPDTTLVVDSEGRFRYADGRYWIHPRSVNALEFYMGALLAIDSLKNQGIDAKIAVFDTMRDTVKMAQLLRNPEMKNMDLMIGPFNTELVNQVASFARENKIYYVSPTANNAASLNNNPYLMQVNAGEINTVAPMVDYISKQKNIHVTLIGNKHEADQTLFNAYLNKLKTVFADSDLTVHRTPLDSLQQPVNYLKEDQMNVVIIPVVDEAFVNIVTSRLHALAHSYNINLYGLANWIKFTDLDPEYLHTLEFRYATAFYIDYGKPQVQKFLQQYRKFYYTEPTMLTGYGGISSYAYQFAFLGYDVAYYFVSALKKYGKDFGSCIPDFRLPLLQSDFCFRKPDTYCGYMNTHLDIYRYSKDYLIVKEEQD